MLLANLVALGQAGTIHGQVKFEQARGVTLPLENATVDLLRLDVPGKYETKTDEKGHFEFGDVSSVGKYILAFSAPNAAPTAFWAVGIHHNHGISLVPGNGRRLTQDEAQALVGIDPSSGSENTDSNTIVFRSLEAGNQALAARRYNDAIRDFDRGIEADSHQAALWTGRAKALGARGAEAYNAALISQGEEAKAVRMKAALLDFSESFEAANKAVEIARTEPAAQSSDTDLQTIKVDALRARAEAMRLFVTKVDPSQSEAAVAAYREYLETETDQGLRLQAQRQSAQMLVELRQPAKALLEFQHILESAADDVEALLGMAL
jgi:tetratricopeptide (TPR) repeat protein